ncbi:MAG: Crp/Fnr family transcriptional regulator, partial [Campylobacterota bacterium]|nr:Crp/Fnr family transcriptional regulator [Campylobacterota bacterium]
ALLDGHLKLYKTGIKSNEVVLHYFTQPTMIAEMASLEGIKFPATAIATKDNTKVLLIDKEKFLRLLEEDSTFSFHIIRSLTKKIKALELAINRNLVFDATTKVAMYINNNPIEFKNGKNKKIASELNITPETLSRVLRKLKEIKIIDKKLNLLDQDKLQMFINFNLN